MRDSNFRFDISTTANILRDSRKKFDKFDRNLAENELFCVGTLIFGVTNRLKNSTNTRVTSDGVPIFRIDRYPRDA
jgi:hypothetical protein